MFIKRLACRSSDVKLSRSRTGPGSTFTNWSPGRIPAAPPASLASRRHGIGHPVSDADRVGRGRHSQIHFGDHVRAWRVSRSTSTSAAWPADRTFHRQRHRRSPPATARRRPASSGSSTAPVHRLERYRLPSDQPFRRVNRDGCERSAPSASETRVPAGAVEASSPSRLPAGHDRRHDPLRPTVLRLPCPLRSIHGQPQLLGRDDASTAMPADTANRWLAVSSSQATSTTRSSVFSPASAATVLAFGEIASSSA